MVPSLLALLTAVVLVTSTGATVVQQPHTTTQVHECSFFVPELVRIASKELQASTQYRYEWRNRSWTLVLDL